MGHYCGQEVEHMSLDLNLLTQHLPPQLSVLVQEEQDNAC